MNPFKSLPAIAALVAAPLATQANAQVAAIAAGNPVIASYHARGMCLDVRASDKVVLLWACHSGSNQAFRFRTGDYGHLALPAGPNEIAQCLTGDGSRDGSPLTLQPCTFPNPRQMWRFLPDGSLRNEMSKCADIHSGRRDQGAPIIMWPCNAGASNQRWYPAVSTKSATLGLAGLSALAKATENNGTVQGILSRKDYHGGNMVAAGGGNLVVADAGSMVAAGGGNMVAAGGGNIVAGGAGSMVAAGGGNMVAAGGGNVVPTGAGRLVPDNWTFFSGASPLVGNDGASFGAKR